MFGPSSVILCYVFCVYTYKFRKCILFETIFSHFFNCSPFPLIFRKFSFLIQRLPLPYTLIPFLFKAITILTWAMIIFISVLFPNPSIHCLILINPIYLWFASLCSRGFLIKLSCEQYFPNSWIFKTIVNLHCLWIPT